MADAIRLELYHLTLAPVIFWQTLLKEAFRITLLAIILSLHALAWIVAVTALRVGLGRLKQAANSGEPRVSILVAARNEEASIDATLRALLAQDYPATYLEIIIIDDGSEDATAEIVRSQILKASNLRLLTAPPAPKGIAPKKNALLSGIAASTGEVILTTDADCRPYPGWVSGMVKYFDTATVAVVGYSPVNGSVARFDAFVNGVISAGSIGLGSPTTAVGRNFAYRRKAFDAIGGFGKTIQGASGDDDLLLQRFAGAGGKIAFATDPATFVPARGAATTGDWLRMKRRHLSAGARYGTGLVTMFTIFYVFHAGLIASIGFSLGGMTSWWVTGLVWGVKVAADWLALLRGAGVLRQRDWVLQWLIAEAVSPLLVVALTPLALFGKVRWKGRELER